MTETTDFFDLKSPRALFLLLKQVEKRFGEKKNKRVEDLLLLVFGFTHLREWIAPGYSPKKKPHTPEEQFYCEIFEFPEFKILQQLCNQSKHMATSSSVRGAIHGSTLDEWEDLDSVQSMDCGPVLAYFIDGKNIEDVISAVRHFYERNWFELVKGDSSS
ncbi:hypothetical protein SAMN05216571_11840 [Onishia taeanensis]|uniref:Uncharacterized protein n=1 Tax=Onishia taeanensis TaxID=284577 RepID=A0A1G7V3G9_9GAMM|nr:hypothetical protein [Halomonas taeanensis]SDG53909.1 hypothetical protein SAMN05216571_11840 [Halomonas taeanensis]